MNKDQLNKLLRNFASDEAAATPFDCAGPTEGLRRLRAGMQRLRDDPDEAARVDGIVEAVHIDRDYHQMFWEAIDRRDFVTAERYLRRAADRGNEEAAYYLAALLRARGHELRREGHVEDGEKLLAEAEKWYQQASAVGVAEALEASDEMNLAAQDQPRQAEPPAGDISGGHSLPVEEPTLKKMNPPLPVGQEPRSGPCYAVGVELRPYKFTAVLLDGAGNQLAMKRRELARMDVETVVSSIRATTKSLLAKLPRSIRPEQVALGVQLGGPVDTETGTVQFYRKDPPHSAAHGRYFQWEDEELGQRLELATGLRTVVENDANALAIWEQWFGVGRETPNFAVVLIREGVGGSVVTNGQLFPGPVEIGNFITWHGDVQMSDAGLRGALETTAGTTGQIAGVSQRAGFEVEDIDIAADLADEPDAESRGLADPFTAAGVATASAIAYLINFAKPTDVVLYVPTVLAQPDRRAADAFWKQAKDFDELVSFKAFRGCTLTLRSLEPNQGAAGAALVALERCCLKTVHSGDRADVESNR